MTNELFLLIFFTNKTFARCSNCCLLCFLYSNDTIKNSPFCNTESNDTYTYEIVLHCKIAHSTHKTIKTKYLSLFKNNISKEFSKKKVTTRIKYALCQCCWNLDNIFSIYLFIMGPHNKLNFRGDQSKMFGKDTQKIV